MSSTVVEVLVAVNTVVSAGVLVFVVRLAYHAGRFVQRFEDLESDVSTLIASGARGQDAIG